LIRPKWQYAIIEVRSNKELYEGFQRVRIHHPELHDFPSHMKGKEFIDIEIYKRAVKKIGDLQDMVFRLKRGETSAG
jgi:hypothetical protein